MMPFDFAPLTAEHFVVLLIAFVAVYGLLALLLRGPTPRLRPVVPGSHIYYAGVVLLGVSSVLAYIITSDPRLKIGLLGAAFLTLAVGVVDENRPLRPAIQFAWQLVIVLIAVSWGWSIAYVSHPTLDSVINLAQASVAGIALPGSLLAIVWLLLLMNAMNWLDGVDGLASGVGVVAFVTLGAVSLLPAVQDSYTLALSLVGVGSLLGLLLWNFPPARVFLGTSGSWWLGLYVGLVAIVGGGKIVTTLLVLALPVADFLLVAGQRLMAGNAPWQGGDVRHLHDRLRQAGLSDRTITLSAITITAVLGAGAVLLQTQQKIIALIVAACMVGVLGAALVIWQARASHSADEKRTQL